MGFTLNASDIAGKASELKYVGRHTCRACGEATGHSLQKLVVRTDMYYAGAAITEERFAVICNECRNGYYVDENQKKYIMENAAKCISIEEDGVKLVPYGGSRSFVDQPGAYSRKCTCGAPIASGDLFCGSCGKPVQQLSAPAAQLPKQPTCTCGAVLQEGDLFCGNCGKPVQKQLAAPAVEMQKKPTCTCGAVLQEGDLFCGNCGKPVRKQVAPPVEEPPKKPVCPYCGGVLEDGDLFCANCGKPAASGQKQEAIEAAQEIKGPVCTCGAELQEGDVFCPVCGERQQTKTGDSKGLGIFKLSPKKNCKECGSPTCMAFSMKVAQGEASIDKCPYFSEEAKVSLGLAVEKPAVKKIVFEEKKPKQPVIEEGLIFTEYKPLVTTKTAEDPMAKFRRRRVCPECKLMFAADKEVCAICGSPLVDKK